jgi:hypothetical protein
MPSTDKELEALFYATNGLNWTKSDNWLVGNPCTDQWFGITCNSNGNIIGMYVISDIDVLVVATGSERVCVCVLIMASITQRSALQQCHWRATRFA